MTDALAWSSFSLSHQAPLLLNFTAGGFIYVATVGLIPCLLHKTSLARTVAELGAFLLGVGAMVLVTLLEGYLG